MAVVAHYSKARSALI